LGWSVAEGYCSVPAKRAAKYRVCAERRAVWSKHLAAKPWKGEGPGILEVVKDYDGDTYRAIYTVRFARAVYVLHAFQKKSPRGIETRQSDVDLVSARLKMAQRDYEERYGQGG